MKVKLLIMQHLLLQPKVDLSIVDSCMIEVRNDADIEIEVLRLEELLQEEHGAVKEEVVLRTDHDVDLAGEVLADSRPPLSDAVLEVAGAVSPCDSRIDDPGFRIDQGNGAEI